MIRSKRRPDSSFYIEPRGGDRYPLDIPRWCADGGKPLLISPQGGIARDEIDRSIRSLWRYQAALPVEISKPISLGEGCTPLVQMEWDDFRPFFKLEWFNPTCSFRIAARPSVLSYLRRLASMPCGGQFGQWRRVRCGIWRRGRMRVKILAPAYTSPAKIAQICAYGAEVRLSRGRARSPRKEAIRQSSQIFYSSHNWQPFFRRNQIHRL